MFDASSSLNPLERMPAAPPPAEAPRQQETRAEQPPSRAEGRVVRATTLEPRAEEALREPQMHSELDMLQRRLERYQSTLDRSDIDEERRARVQQLIKKTEEQIAQQQSEGAQVIEFKRQEPQKSPESKAENIPSTLSEAVQERIKRDMMEAEFNARSAERELSKLQREAEKLSTELGERAKLAKDYKARARLEPEFKGVTNADLESQLAAKNEAVAAKQMQVEGYKHELTPEFIADKLGRELVNPGEQVSDRQLQAVKAVIESYNAQKQPPLKAAA